MAKQNKKGFKKKYSRLFNLLWDIIAGGEIGEDKIIRMKNILEQELERARLEGEIKGVDCAIGELRSEAFENYWKLPSRLGEYVGKLEQRLSKLSRIESSLEM